MLKTVRQFPLAAVPGVTQAANAMRFALAGPEADATAWCLQFWAQVVLVATQELGVMQSLQTALGTMLLGTRSLSTPCAREDAVQPSSLTMGMQGLQVVLAKGCAEMLTREAAW